MVSEREDEFSDRLRTSRSFFGFTALHYAVLADQAEIVQTLLDAGANPIAENELGHRPADYASGGVIAKILKDHTSKVKFFTS